jgi:hypothetical protein
MRTHITQSLAALPSIHPGFGKSSFIAEGPYEYNITCLPAIPTESNGGNHTPAFTSAAATPEAHQACLEVCKALALTGLRVIGDEQFYAEVNSPPFIAALHTKIRYLR